MKPTVQKHKDVRGRKVTGYTARLALIETFTKRSTPAEAIADCERETVAALERLERSTLIGQWNGHTYVISPDVIGWRYWIDTFSRTDSYSQLAFGATRETTTDAALCHLAQTLWTRDVPDDTAYVEGLPYGIRAELISYFTWQREYARLVSKGYTDNDARAIIGGFKRETADPIAV